MLRRVIGRDGRSRQYVNGQALPAQSVRALGELLIDIHGQQEFQSLVSRDAQREIVDAHGVRRAGLAARRRRSPASGGSAARSATRSRRRRGTAARGSSCCATRSASSRPLGSAPGEAESLARGTQPARQPRPARGGGPGRARTPATKATAADAHALAARAASQLRGGRGARRAPRSARCALVEESLIALREAGAELAAYLEGLDADPARQEQVERRVAAIEDLARKHRVVATALPAKLDELRAHARGASSSRKLALGGLDERIAGLRTRYRRGRDGALGAARRAAARKLGARGHRA